jgi:protein-L-isoaspartate(D-aspartate) O-methyltransferase
MVRSLMAEGAIHRPSVRRAFLAEPRERYVPEIAELDGLEAVYRPEAALVTARDRNGAALSSSSAPGVMAPMLEALQLRPGLRVLEIGAGTGYNASLLKRLVGEDGSVTSIEVDARIARQARSHLAAGGHRARVVVGDGRAGWPGGAPFDSIIVTASSDFVPKTWRDQLVEGGRLVLPFRFRPDTQAILGLRRERDLLVSTTTFGGGFMPLREPGAVYRPVEAQSSLGASVTSGAKGSTLARISGPALEHLSEAQRRALLAEVLSPGRRGNTVVASRAPALLMFLLLHPHAQTVHCTFGDRFGAGVLGPRGSSFAAFTCARKKPGQLFAWGGTAAEEKLAGLVDEWRGAGKPAIDRLIITIDYGRDEVMSAKPWRQLTLNQGTLSLNWRQGAPARTSQT